MFFQLFYNKWVVSETTPMISSKISKYRLKVSLIANKVLIASYDDCTFTVFNLLYLILIVITS